MAVLRNQRTGERLALRAFHLFGRRKTGTDTVLEDKGISHIHASFRWTGSEWKIQDHSKNGTWIGEKRLPAGETIILNLHDLIGFTGPHRSDWQVVDTSPPATVLVPLQQESPIVTLHDIHALPSEEKPELSIYLSDSGEWTCEDKEGTKKLNDGDLIRLSDGIWRFFCAGPFDSTNQMDNHNEVPLPQVRFDFKVSLDEEHVFLNAFIGEHKIDLGERAHHYVLLTLARQRLDDWQRGLDPSSQGWMEVESLSQNLRIDPFHLNIQIYRARKQLIRFLPSNISNPAGIVERRAGQIRFMSTNFQVVQGDKKKSIET